MFKKLKEKITEEVKISPQRFQQLTQTVTDKLHNNSATSDENFFSIGDDDSTAMSQGFSDISLTSPQAQRRNSASSVASDVSFLPRYESVANMYHLQSDLDVSASEVEDNASTSSQLGRLSKEQIYAAFQKAQMRYHKYRGRFTDLARHYKELERENGKMKSVLVETQDKAIRRVNELKEQCQLEQKAKAHLESALRDDLDERQLQIEALQTKNSLLSNSHKNDDNMEELTRFLNEARKEIETLNEKLQEMKANQIIFQSKEDEFKAKMAQFAEREKENNLVLAQNKMELHNELVAKEAEISALKEQLKNTSKFDNLQAQNGNLIDKLETLQHKCNNYEAELLKMQQYRSENEDLREKVKAGEVNLSKLREDAKKSLLSLEEKVRAQIEEEFAAKEKELREDYRKKIEENGGDSDLQSKILNLGEEIKQLAEINELVTLERDRAVEKYNELEQDHLNLIEDGASVRGKLSNTERQLAALENEKSALAIKVEHLERNMVTLQRSNEEFERNISRMDEERLELKSKIEDTSAKLTESEENIRKLQHENVSITEELRVTSTELTEAYEAKQIAEVQGSALGEQLRLLEEQQESNSMEITQSKVLEMKVQQLEEERDSLFKKMEQERLMYEEILNDNDRLKENEGKLKTYEETVHRLEEKIAVTTAETNQYLEELRETSETKTNLEACLRNAEQQIRLYEERDEGVELERNESELLKMKVQCLDQERDNLLEKMQNERTMYEKLLNDNERLKQAEEQAKTYEKSVQHLKQQVFKLSEENRNYLEELRETSAAKMNLQEELSKMEQNLRLLEEKDEAVELESTESKLLELKLETLQEERDNLLKKMESEEVMYEKLLNDQHELHRVEEALAQMKAAHQQLVEEHSKSLEENRFNVEELRETASARSELESQIAKLQERLRIFEEKDEAIDLERTESKLLEMKLQKSEEEMKTIMETFEAESRLTDADAHEKQSRITHLQVKLDRFKHSFDKFEDLFEERYEFLSKLPGNPPKTNNFKHLTSIEEKIEHFEKVFIEERDFFKNLLRDNETYTGRLKELEKRNEDLSEEIEAMRMNMADLQASQSNLESSLARSKDLEKELNHLREDNLRLMEEKQWNDANVQAVETKLAKISSDNNCLSEENQLLVVKIEEYKLRYEDSQRKLEELNQNNMDRYVEDSEKLQKQVEELERRIRDLENEKQLLEDEVAECKMQPVKTEKYQSEIEELRDKLTKYKSLDLTNRTSIEFYENELDKMKKLNEKLTRQLDETLVTLNHCSELSSSTEIEYLRNVLYNYMLGKESIVLARVIAAVCKFDPQQTEAVMAKEQQKQTLLGHLGIL